MTIQYNEIKRMQDKRNSLLRVSVLDGKTHIFVNDTIAMEGAFFVLTREQIVELGKALLGAWEVAVE